MALHELAVEHGYRCLIAHGYQWVSALLYKCWYMSMHYHAQSYVVPSIAFTFSLVDPMYTGDAMVHLSTAIPRREIF